jgi:hypothetical protein
MTLEVESLPAAQPRLAPNDRNTPRTIRLTHIDGKLPNIALMKLSHWHKAQGDTVVFRRTLERDLFEPEYDIVYGSTIFEFARHNLDRLLRSFPEAIVGGTGSYADKGFTVEQYLGVERYEHLDYSIYPEVDYSIGFTQRGCRLRCGFCYVPAKEGKPYHVNEVARIWRGSPWPKHIALLDNDFFGGPQWRERAQEMMIPGFKICLNQGINIRSLTDEQAEILASLPLYDFQFQERRIYTAWDSIRELKVFMRGVERLTKYGCPPSRLMVYMLIGYEPGETDELRLQRFNELVNLGAKPYPMPYNNADKRLRRFQRWAVTGAHTVVSFADYDPRTYDRERRRGDDQQEMLPFEIVD